MNYPKMNKNSDSYFVLFLNNNSASKVNQYEHLRNKNEVKNRRHKILVR